MRYGSKEWRPKQRLGHAKPSVTLAIYAHIPIAKAILDAFMVRQPICRRKTRREA